jgi:hypothetical protein
MLIRVDITQPLAKWISDCANDWARVNTGETQTVSRIVCCLIAHGSKKKQGKLDILIHV